MHRNNFDALRLLAAFAVMVSHQFAIMGLPEPRLFAGQTLGTYAVFVFFAISGYLVAASWRSDPDILRFTVRRILRIAPAYIVALAVADYAIYLAGIDEFIGSPRTEVNGSLWTIPIEVQCYLIFMALAATTKHGGALLLLSSFLLGYDKFQEQFAGFFALGAMISQYAVLRRWYGMLFMILFGALLIPVDQYFWAIVFLLTPLVVLIGTQAWPALRKAGANGDFSYGVYLYAFPVQQFVARFVAPDSVLAGLAISVAIVTPLAVLSWRLIELPALSMKRQLVRTLPEPDPSKGITRVLPPGRARKSAPQ